MVCRLRAVLVELIPAGVPKVIRTARAARVLRSIRPEDAVQGTRCELAEARVRDLHRTQERGVALGHEPLVFHLRRDRGRLQLLDGANPGAGPSRLVLDAASTFSRNLQFERPREVKWGRERTAAIA